MDINYIQSINGAVEFNYVLADFLPAGSVHFSQGGVEIFNYNRGFFSLQFLLVVVSVFLCIF